MTGVASVFVVVFGRCKEDIRPPLLSQISPNAPLIHVIMTVGDEL
jgi:hypothetical protein